MHQADQQSVRKENKGDTSEFRYFDRDISWLSFNERVLMEAENKNVPPLERLNFAAIYSSNLDEFFRVRMPALRALTRVYEKEDQKSGKAEIASAVVDKATQIIYNHLDTFGKILVQTFDELAKQDIHILYDKQIPEAIRHECTHYFYNHLLSFLKFHRGKFFPDNNRLYLALTTNATDGEEEMLVVNIPSDELPRFLKLKDGNKTYFVFIDDIIKDNLPRIIGDFSKSFTFKVTRDAELDLSDVYVEDIASRIEEELAKRDYGLATRLLHEPGVSQSMLKKVADNAGLDFAVCLAGGRYHNLRDLASIDVDGPGLKYEPWRAITSFPAMKGLLLDRLETEEFLIHTPYQSYEPVLRFFNEAASVKDVSHIYITMYRVARDSRILNALLSALHNGKKVTVAIELKARFDEANNLKWAKRLKKAGAEVIYTDTELKVHAKIALVKRRTSSGKVLAGLLATGNFNERTAKIYSDQIFFTGDQKLLEDVQKIFKSIRRDGVSEVNFKHLLVGRHNLKEKLTEMIDREVTHANNGLPARIVLKLNALEDRKLINKLYHASCAGVKIDLIIRGICCLVPGVPGMSENISVKRIVDRYLEHSRMYIFCNNGDENIYLSSADWMSRNIYRRIEVCFPVYNDELRREIKTIVDIQLADNVQAVQIDQTLANKRIVGEGTLIRAQFETYKMLAEKIKSAPNGM